MRVNINLASQPYEDVRKFLARWGTAVLLLALATAALVYFTVSNYMQARSINREMSRLQAEITRLDGDRQQAIAILNQLQNKDTTEKSRFLNELIARKAFSWTRVFTDLEQIMPRQLHVVSIRPEVNEQSQVELRMTVAGTNRERANDLLKKMEQSNTFRNAYIRSEVTQAANQQQPQPVVQFEISSIYVPETPASSGPTTTQASATPPQGGAQ